MKAIIYCSILIRVFVFGATGYGATLKKQLIIITSAETAQKNEKDMSLLLSFDLGKEKLQLLGDTTELAVEYALIWRTFSDDELYPTR
ncbi:MAG: hypothetical protein IT273_04185 [Chitinophagales bacterium]|nr:hypothetical protein [Chitinophagales bacterium]